jgi:hypothetical protein
MEYPDAPGSAGPPFGLSFRKGTIMQTRFISAAPPNPGTTAQATRCLRALVTASRSPESQP